MAGLDPAIQSYRRNRARCDYLKDRLGGHRGVGVWIVEPKVKRAGLHRFFGAFSLKTGRIPVEMSEVFPDRRRIAH
jgi:hypothetical protein